jgi:hypothetical protein
VFCDSSSLALILRTFLDEDTRGTIRVAQLSLQNLELRTPRVPVRKEMPSFSLYIFLFLLRRVRDQSTGLYIA